MRIVCLLVVFIQVSFFGFAQNYAVSQISKNLLENANVVVRVYDEVYQVQSKSQASHKRKIVRTLLNSNAKDFSDVVVYYNKLNTIKSFQASMYDADGKLIKKSKNSDVRDFSANTSSLMDDSRVKVISFTITNYPVTIEYEVEYDDRNLLFYPRWVPQPMVAYSVENSRFTISSPSGLPIRYKALNLPEPIISDNKGNATHSWQVTNMAALQLEPFAPYYHERYPVLYTAATYFQVQGYDGDLSTWESFARWNYELNKGRLDLPDNIKSKVDELIAGINNDPEKIKILYNYLQQTTRYISVQLGIGGWQTFDAKYVAERKYGDCKALTNYMMALLAHANIKSYYSLIRAGENEEPFVEDFPHSAFNHVILAIPVKSDTIWLECTSQQVLPGYLGSFTGNRKALLVTENGGKLVNTPSYTAKDNSLSRSIKVTFNEDGTALANIQSLYTGIMQDRLWVMVKTNPNEELRKNLIERLNLPSSIIQSFGYETIADDIPKVLEKAQLQLNKYATITGKRFSIQLNMLSRMNFVPRAVANRTQPIRLRNAFNYTDTIIYTIPAGYSLESKPQNTNIKTEFGDYISDITIKNNQIIYRRTFSMHIGKFGAEKYTDLVNFYSNISKADNARVVLVKQ